MCEEMKKDAFEQKEENCELKDEEIQNAAGGLVNSLDKGSTPTIDVLGDGVINKPSTKPWW